MAGLMGNLASLAGWHFHGGVPAAQVVGALLQLNGSCLPSALWRGWHSQPGRQRRDSRQRRTCS